ncbi:MAG: response regulator transcription factor [Candidatus Omnitrophota bacterium]|nr:response regulator transcription factor [Candidatus Omnitrophota bacterium]MDZ4243017.1 response regulator transcription factor [Candidatus Omnitrophota bacterium]
MARILIVEDNPEFCRMLLAYLSRHAHEGEISSVVSGGEAVARAQAFQPDVVIIGIQLPQGNGLETARAIGKIIPGCQFIILSMFDASRYQFLVKGIKVAAMIEKGALLEELLPAIKRALKPQSPLSRKRSFPPS